jgi:hypothetical protein
VLFGFLLHGALQRRHLGGRKRIQKRDRQHSFGNRDGDLGNKEYPREFEERGHKSAVSRRICDCQLDRRGQISGQVACYGGHKDSRAGVPVPPALQKQPGYPRSNDAKREKIRSERGQSSVREQQGLEHKCDQSQRRHGFGAE